MAKKVCEMDVSRTAGCKGSSLGGRRSLLSGRAVAAREGARGIIDVRGVVEGAVAVREGAVKNTNQRVVRGGGGGRGKIQGAGGNGRELFKEAVTRVDRRKGRKLEGTTGVPTTGWAGIGEGGGGSLLEKTL